MLPKNATAFAGTTEIASAPLADVSLAVYHASHTDDPILVFDDVTGRVIDLDLRGTDDEIAARYAEAAPAADTPRGRGRPKLGVVSREVTLLPRHWEWLAAQKGGASATLRKLIDEARKRDAGSTERRLAQERTYHVMAALAGDLPDFEEASRALFAEDHERFEDLIAPWPGDVAAYLLRMLTKEIP